MIRKNVAARLALLWLCESLHSFFLKEPLWWDGERVRRGRGTESRGRREGGKGGGGRGCWGQNHRRIVVCFPTVNSGGSGTGQLNIQNSTMRQRAWSSCGTWLSPGSGVWSTEARLFIYTGGADREETRCRSDTHTHPDGRHGLTHSHTPQSDSAQTAVHQGQDERIDSCTRFRTSASSRKYLKTYCLPRSFYSSKIKLKTKTRCHEVITLWFKTIKKLFNIITTEEETTALTLNHRRLLDVFINELTRQEQRYRHRRLSRRHCW